MRRSPLAYPLNRAADSDAGGAADLQTDIMRFMAILSMCLLAIFALVQSIPLAPVEETASAEPAPIETREAAPVRIAPPPAQPVAEPLPAEQTPAEQTVVLTRPKWVPKYTPAKEAAAKTPPPAPAESPVPAAPAAAPPTVTAPPEEEGFTLRFASDTALMRSVAAHHVGLYAIEQGRARRMTISESRISFWDASTPNAFHEMESGTVPASVIEALDRAGAGTAEVNWGVTLPGRMKAQLDDLLQAHRGGTLIITADGNIHWEAS